MSVKGALTVEVQAYTRDLAMCCFVLLPIHPPNQPGMGDYDVIGWQKDLLGIFFTVADFSFIFLTNFSLCQKAIIVI